MIDCYNVFICEALRRIFHYQRQFFHIIFHTTLWSLVIYYLWLETGQRDRFVLRVITWGSIDIAFVCVYVCTYVSSKDKGDHANIVVYNCYPSNINPYKWVLYCMGSVCNVFILTRHRGGGKGVSYKKNFSLYNSYLFSPQPKCTPLTCIKPPLIPPIQ